MTHSHSSSVWRNDGCWDSLTLAQRLRLDTETAEYPHLFGLFLLVVDFGLTLDGDGLAGHIAPSQALADISARGGGLLGGGHRRIRRMENRSE